MIVYPNAKINIGLNIVERRPDGYHNIESIFYPINLQDALEIKTLTGNVEDTKYKFKLAGTQLDGSPEDNLVVRAFKLLQKDYDLPPVSMYLYKHIPTGAGLGGGSSDAAYTIRTLNDIFALHLSAQKMEEYAAMVGADCAFFIQNKPVFATGIGNVFSDVELPLMGKTLVLVKPDIFVSTSDAYSSVKPKHPEVRLDELVKLPLEEWKSCVFNDFEYSVFQKYPEIAAIKDQLYDMGATYASMSGSGSAVYGIFDSPQENVDEAFSGCFCRQRTL